MDAFFFYIVKSSLCLLLFYALFKTLLSKETFFRFNRLVLLTGTIVCAVLPLLEVRTETALPVQAPVQKIERLIKNDATTSIVLSAAEIQTPLEIDIHKTPDAAAFKWTQRNYLGLIYGTGFLSALAGLCISVLRMLRLMRKGYKTKNGRYTIIVTKQKVCPFSFGNYIVLSETDYRQNPEEIVMHEQIHAEKGHSLDLFLMEFFVLFHWFNPAVWLLKREIQDVHEYEADKGVINQGIDATQYQLLLVKKAVGARSYAIANSFNHSKIKNRITMMLKRKSTQWARLKLLLFVPLAAAMLQAFARPEITPKNETLLISSEGTTILPENGRVADVYLNQDSIIPPAKSTKKETVRVVSPIPPEGRMTEKEKAATQEFEAASKKYSEVMAQHASKMENSFNAPEMQKLTKEFEAASQKFSKAMEGVQLNYSPKSEAMEAQSKEFEKMAEKFGKVMEQHASELEKGIESQEVKIAKEEFKAASEKFKASMSQLQAEMRNIQDNPKVKAIQEEYKALGEKYKQEMKQFQLNMEEMKNDPKVQAAKEEFQAASEKYKQAMKGYWERVKAEEK